MVDIGWARENSKVDNYTAKLIEKGKKVLEEAIDEAIKKQCNRGEQGAQVWLQDGAYIDGVGVRDEALKYIADKYKEAGYFVTVYRDGYKKGISVIWKEGYGHHEVLK